jgi:type VI secretion system protein ImpA
MPFREDLLNPIAGANPSGANLRYDTVTDKVKEARREDTDVPQGDWKVALKVADHAQVIKLASDAIANKGKDLQLAVWLVEAHVRKEGFTALAPGFRFLHGLLEQFWDTLYPEIEDGDFEIRAAPLEWLGTRLADPIRVLPITSNKLSAVNYTVSRTVGYESDDGEKEKLRQELIAEGKTSGEEFDQAVDETPKAFYETLDATLDDALANLATLIEFCDEKFGDASPSFIKTRSAIEEIQRLVRGFVAKKGGPSQAAQAEEEPEPETAQPEPVSSGAAAAPARAPVRRASGGVEPDSVEDAAARLAAVARYLRQQDQYNISPYLILRGLRWGEIRYNGPQIDVNMLEAPSPELRKQLKQAALDEDWDKVLETTETAMETPCGRGWLDLQRYAVKALEAKGEYFQFVSNAIRGALRALLQELPGLETMSMLDDTPTANTETLAWIRMEVLPPAGEGAAPAPTYQAPEPEPEPEAEPEPQVSAEVSLDEVPPSMDAEDTPVDNAPDAFGLALEAARGGRLSEAVEILSAELERARSGRGRFQRRMQLAHIFMASGREKIAYPILQGLSEEIDRRGLEEWEAGDLLAHPLALLLKCGNSLNGDEEQMKSIYARICRLDPKQALHALD